MTVHDKKNEELKRLEANYFYTKIRFSHVYIDFITFMFFLSFHFKVFRFFLTNSHLNYVDRKSQIRLV